MSKVKIKQVRSLIGRTQRQRATMQALGLRRIGHTIEKELTDTIKGMITKVSHLINVEEV